MPIWLNLIDNGIMEMRIPKRGREPLLEEPPREVPNQETMGVVLRIPPLSWRERKESVDKP